MVEQADTEHYADRTGTSLLICCWPFLAVSVPLRILYARSSDIW